MSGSTFVDTNVLIYAHDVDAGQKHEIARDVRAVTLGSGVAIFRVTFT
jgi:predicted nucleic acid-binding protein